MSDEMQRNAQNCSLDALLQQLTADQLRFVAKRLLLPTDIEAAKEAKISLSTVGHWPPIVKDAIKLLALDGVHLAHEQLRRALPEAIEVKIAGLKSNNEKIKQDASTEIIDRQLGKPVQKSELTGANQGPIEIADASDILRKLLFDAPQD